jgi:hypothetical protein
MRIKAAAIAAVIAAAAGTAATAGTALAGPANVTAVTRVTDRADSGNGGTWAYDDLTRTLNVVRDPSLDAAAPAGDVGYDATVTDKGTFTTVVGALSPNQAVAGVKVAHAVKGTVTGGISYTVYAPVADVADGTVPATENDNFAATPLESTGNWPQQAFETATGVTVTEGSTWSWTYGTGCETWTDSAANGDGNQAADGNITGKACAVPVLFGGKPVYVAPTREEVTYEQTLPGWTEFTIVGPGAINGHRGWVDGVKGLNAGYYSGLLPLHGYTVLYVPVTGQGSSHQVPGTHVGIAYFVSDTVNA